MKKTFILAFTIAMTSLLSCNNNDSKGAKSITSTTSTNANSSDLYFDYTIDGKEMHVDAADIMCTYQVNNTDNVFNIHAGKEDGTTLLLTIPYDMTKPSTTPSGSSDYKMNITQGSASLQNYPEKNYTSNSYNSTYPETTPIIPEAIVITSSEKSGEDARIISGTFNTKTYGDKSHNDTKSTDHVIVGNSGLSMSSTQ